MRQYSFVYVPKSWPLPYLFLFLILRLSADSVPVISLFLDFKTLQLFFSVVFSLLGKLQ